VNYRLIFWGFPVYTVALLFGLINNLHLGGIVFDPKQVCSFITWIVYLAIFYLMVKGDWRKKKLHILQLSAFF